MILIVIIISVAMLFAILSSFIPFSNAYWNIAQYSSAYYAAMWAVERGCLAIRYAWPGFDGESWWKYSSSSNSWHYNTWNNSDYFLPKFISYWNAWNTTLYWKVNSKINSIPMPWMWDVDPAFTNGPHYDYNALNYNSPILIPLWRVWDIPVDKYYSEYWNYGLDSAFNWITWDFRLTPYLFGKIAGASQSDYAQLCTNHCPWSVDPSVDISAPIVDWVIKWVYDDWISSRGVEVSILPTEAIDVWGTYYVHESRDSVIRKKQIGFWGEKGVLGPQITFSNNKHPLRKADFYHPRNDGWIYDLNVISRVSDDLKKTNNWDFIDILRVIKNPYISLELVNNLWSEGSWFSSWAHHLYPFLEYRFKSIWWYFSDRYFTIKWEWKVWKYDVRLQVKKPTLKDSSLWNFTIIF